MLFQACLGFAAKPPKLKSAKIESICISGHSLSHSMDVLLQFSALHEDNVSHILPLIRYSTVCKT